MSMCERGERGAERVVVVVTAVMMVMVAAIGSALVKIATRYQPAMAAATSCSTHLAQDLRLHGPQFALLLRGRGLLPLSHDLPLRCRHLRLGVRSTDARPCAAGATDVAGAAGSIWEGSWDGACARVCLCRIVGIERQVWGSMALRNYPRARPFCHPYEHT